MNIHDVQQVYLKVHEDDRGYLFEVIHNSDPLTQSSATIDNHRVPRSGTSWTEAEIPSATASWDAIPASAVKCTLPLVAAGSHSLS